MEKELIKARLVEYYMFCTNCKKEYTVTETPGDSEDWKRIANSIGKELGWCNICYTTCDC